MRADAEPFQSLQHVQPGEQSQDAASRLRNEARTMGRRAPTMQVKDITTQFNTAAQQLKPGNLIKDEHFTLFEAVGALEIMDPKMDSGFVSPGDSFEPDFDVTAELQPAQILWIMDELLRLEMTFQDGYPLSQNIFTSLHVFRLISPDVLHPPSFHLAKPPRSWNSKLVDAILMPYCIAVIKTCESTIGLIQSQTYFEEEDFVTHSFGRDFLPNIDVPINVDLLLQQAAKALLMMDFDLTMREALSHRLHLRMHLIKAIAGDHHAYTRTCWIQARDSVRSLNNHHHLAQPIPDAFSLKIQRQLATSTPPRPMPDTTWEEAYQKWIRLCDDVLAAIDLTRPEICGTPHSLMRASLAFVYRNPPPFTLARAKMQDIMFSNDNVGDTCSHIDLVVLGLRDITLAGSSLLDPASFEVELPSDPRFQCARIVEDFLQKATTQYVDYSRCILQNRCRYRRATLQSIPLWDQLESEARDADKQIATIKREDTTHPLELWARYHHLTAIQQALRLTIELEVLQPHELAHMYLQMSAVSVEKSYVLKTASEATSQRGRAAYRVGDAVGVESVATSLDYVYSLMWLETVTQCLVDSLAEVLKVLESAKVISTRNKPYATPILQFEARNKPFLGLQNSPLLGFDDIRKLEERPTVSVRRCCQAIEERMTFIKTPLQNLKKVTPVQAQYIGTEDQWKKDILNLERTTVAMRIMATSLSRICDARGFEDAGAGQDLSSILTASFPSIEKRYIDWLVVPQIVEGK